MRMVTAEIGVFGVFSDSNFKIIFEVNELTWESIKKHFFNSFIFYILWVMFILGLLGQYLGHIKDRLDVKNKMEIKQKLELLKTFFAPPINYDNEQLKIRNQNVKKITFYLFQNKVQLFKTIFSEDNQTLKTLQTKDKYKETPVIKFSQSTRQSSKKSAQSLDKKPTIIPIAKIFDVKQKQSSITVKQTKDRMVAHKYFDFNMRYDYEMIYENGQYFNKVWNGIQFGHPFLQLIYKYDSQISRRIRVILFLTRLSGFIGVSAGFFYDDKVKSQ